MKTKKVNTDELKFGENGLVCVIAQDYESGEVLLQSYMNRECVDKTFASGYVYYYDPASGLPRKKGEASGNTQKVVTAFLDDDKDCLLLKVRQKGLRLPYGDIYVLCGADQRRGQRNRRRNVRQASAHCGRKKKNPEEGSYTSFLFARGIDKIAKKAGEEAVELVIASKNDDNSKVVAEAADFLYHMMVLLAEKGVKLSEVCSELYKRNK